MPALYLATGKTAGEECSSTYEGRHITLEESYLTHPSHTDGFVDKGDPVLCGENIVGVAFVSAAAATDYVAIDTEGIWFLTVYGTDYEGNSAVAAGDEIFINKTTCLLSKNSNKYTHQRFGYALGTVNSGSSGVCAVKIHWNPDDAIERIGTSTVPMPLNTVGYYGYEKWYSTSITSGAFHGDYTRVDVTGAGTNTVLGGRSKVMLTVDGSGNAYGEHDTLETDTSAGAITGLGCGHRGNVVVANRAHTTGTWYGVMGEIFPLGNTAALPTSNAALCANVQAGTAMDLVGNLMAFGGTDGTTKPIYTHGAGNTSAGSIRVLVNGAIKYLRFYDAE